MTTNAVQSVMPQLKALRADEVKTPAIPVEVYVQEALDLQKWALNDKTQLLAVGLDETLFDALKIRSEACREIQSEWAKVFKSTEEAEREWSVRGKAGFELRDRLLQAFRYAFRNRPDLLVNVATIAEGNSNDDMIQDLSDLAILGKANAELLKAIKLPVALLDEANDTAGRLAMMLAGAKASQAATPEQLDLRNRTYTYLKLAVDEVRTCGKYVFHGNDERLRGYRSEFIRKYNNKAQKEKSKDTN